MLVRFNVKNFLSIEGKECISQEFAMIAGKVRNKKEHVIEGEKLKLLKFASIYGANASGKTNLIKAMAFMQHTILSGMQDSDINSYCRINEDNKIKPCYFEMEILINNRYYTYGFEVLISTKQFIEEWLVEKNETEEIVIFERNILDGYFKIGEKIKNKNLKKKLNMYIGDIAEDNSILFLKAMNQNKKAVYDEFGEMKIFGQIYKWFKSTLDINSPDQPISNYEYLSNTEYLQNSDGINDVSNLIKEFGTGITGFQLVDVPKEKLLSKLPPNFLEKVFWDREGKNRAIILIQ